MYYKHRYNLIRFDLSTSGTAYKLFIKSLYDYVIVKEVTVSDVTVRSYFIGAKDLEANWSNRASLTYSTDIKGRKLVNEGQDWLAAAIGRITELKAGVNYRVEDYPLVWIEDTYYTTYKDDIFQVSVKTDVPTQTEYDAVTIIDLNTQSLTTDFTGDLLGKFTNLQELKVNNNSIQVLDPSELYELIVLDCHNNSIEVLDVSQLTKLTTLYCYINQIEVLDTTNLTKLVNLVCYVNQIEVLDTSQLVDLLVIDCQYNQIQVLDISNSLDLNFLRCNNNQIQVLDVSQLTKLTYIDCNSNQIQSLDVSQLNLLTTFYCYNNLLTNLDIRQNVNLVILICYGNQLDNIVNSQILIDLDTNGLSNGFLQSSIFGGGSLTAAGQTAKINLLSKGWTIVGI